MKKIWIVLLTVAMVGALLAMPGTAVAKPGGGHGKPPAEEPHACASSSLDLTVGPTGDGYVKSTCADVGSDLNGVWKVTFTGYSGRARLVTQLRNSIPGDRCNGELNLYSATNDLLLSANGSGVMTRRIENGMYYTLDTSETEVISGNCTGGDGSAGVADSDSGFVFTVDLQTKTLSSPIAIHVESPATP